MQEESLLYCVYVLRSEHNKYLNQAYVGSTPDPARRLRQHQGFIAGGAKKTAKKRPWSDHDVV
jgi:structure-specific endonuclease subunit SLX1